MADLADLVFLDTETTGLGDNAQAIEIAIVDADGAVIFESYCRPTVPVEPGAQAIHNIGAEKLEDAPSWPECRGNQDSNTARALLAAATKAQPVPSRPETAHVGLSFSWRRNSSAP